MRKAVLVFVFLLTIVWGTDSVFAGIKCSLAASATDISVGQTVAWDISSDPANLRYLWFIDGYVNNAPYIKNGVPGNDPSLTPATETYTYADPGTYGVHFVAFDPRGGPFLCSSNIVVLTVRGPLIARTNIFPNGGTFVQGQYFEIRTDSNTAFGVIVDWITITADDDRRVLESFSAPPPSLTRYFDGGGIFQNQIGRHRLRVTMQTNQGQYEDEVEFNIISPDSAAPQPQPVACVPSSIPTICLPPSPPGFPGPPPQ